MMITWQELSCPCPTNQNGLFPFQTAPCPFPQPSELQTVQPTEMFSEQPPSLSLVSAALIRENCILQCFAGDAEVFKGHILHFVVGSSSSHFATAFRAKLRSDISKRKVTNDKSLQQQTQFVQDVANVLRRNVVQGILVKTPEESGGDGLYRTCSLSWINHSLMIYLQESVSPRTRNWVTMSR